MLSVLESEDSIDDIYIFQVYSNDKEKALKLLVEKYSNSLYKFSLHLCKDLKETEELFQDTWVKVFKGLEKFNRDKSFETWLFTIAINTYKDGYRKKKRWLNRIKDYFDNDEKDREMAMVPSGEGIPQKDIIKSEEKEEIRSAVNKLKDEYRILVILYYFERLSYKEISEMLSIPEGTIKSRLNKGRKLLKDYLEVSING
ncbi:sigma-70 family RNA polymerase sigma factor [Clostridium sp. MSJ-4]|uniref:Sigma-70 family RNA polymerase sigma factor n=1 Tax=Clostridium simiarum TaxID=2841506 RepID=A0ABS6F0Z6_9CLOT|nr:sigma-70 family RNA polymerase sigma factor [Clostridium simiarum]MBU5592172.1 sigma-70 family RNA polymerase sigma factor [Clostridium simiarum]